VATRRRSRRKTISGNLTDIQKRVRYLETRPAPSKLANKVVATKNIAIESITEELVVTNAITRRLVAPAAIVSGNLSVVGDSDGAAVATENIQLEAVDTPQVADQAITNDKLAGDISDDKITSVSASKIGPDLLQDDQLDGIATTKLIGDIEDSQIAGISGSKIIGGVDGDLIVNGSIEAIKIAGVNSTVLIGGIQADQIDGVNADAIIGNIQGNQIEPESITENELGYDSVGFDELQANSVGTAQLQEFSVVEVILDDLSVSRRTIQDDAIIARMINNGAVVTAGIQNLAVTNGKIANDAITTAKIANQNITEAKITSGTGIITAVTAGFGLATTEAVATYGSRVIIGASAGPGSAQVARGDHTHSASGVPSHTHPVNASISGAVTGAGTHGGHTGAGNNGGHTHSVTINSAISTSAPSSLKLKKEISDYQPLDIKNILNLKLKKYKYKNQLRHLHEGINREWMHGYIAEEVQELGFEELLGYDEKGEPASLNYGLLSTLVLELVKVQQTEIDSLKEEIQRLKEKI
jgi:hypothetical protein